MATITFDQTGLSAGVTDRARSDGLATGATVTITVDSAGGTVEFVDVPPGDSSSVSSLNGSGDPVWTFTPTASVYGTWLVQFTPTVGNPVRRAFSVRTPNQSFRIPAFNEKASVVATIANGASHIADSDDNEGGTYRGWWSALNEIYAAIENGVAVSELTGLGSGVATFLATPSSANLAAAVTGETGTGALVFATSPALVTPDLGTPSAATLTNATGLPVSTGISGLGANVATFLATPSSSNLASAVTDETGSGALVFATSPTLVTPALGTPASGVLTNCTGRVNANQTADQIATSGSPVVISSTAPTAHQVLTASSATAASWVSPVTYAQASTSGPTYGASVNNLVFVDISGGNVTVNLPAGHVAGDQIIVKVSTAAGGNTCTIDADASETIDGSTTLVLSADYEWATLVSNGTNWFQIS